MSKPRRQPAQRGKTTQRGYGWRYQQARRKLLASNPRCRWCGEPASTADHFPPLRSGGDWTRLVPSCQKSNAAHIAARKWDAQDYINPRW
jgi:hypothetical protein